jgi:uncharacterized membrane protein YhaH (DUF805 family)
MRHLHNLFSFKGRLRRLDYWLYSAVVFGLLILATAIPAAFLGVDFADKTDPRGVLIQGFGAIALMWPNLAVCAKRAHDRSQSGWWVLLSFLPVIGNIWMIVNLGIMRGTEGVNKYGPEPERRQFTLTSLWSPTPA